MAPERPLGRSQNPKGSSSLRYKAFYFGTTAVVLIVLYSTPVGLLQAEYSRSRISAAFLWLAVACAAAAFLALQGSDPGFISPGISHTRVASVAGADEETVEVSAEAPPVTVTSARPGTPSQRRSNPQPPVVHYAAQPRPPVEHQSLIMPDADPDFGHVIVHPDGTTGNAADEARAAQRARDGHRTCRWCLIDQPPRAHHCKICDQCVATFDHHCTMIGTCIGERNRLRFWLFLLALCFELATAIGILNTGFVYQRAWGDWAAANVVALLTLVFLWCFQVIVFFLLVFHTWLAATNTTTFETSVGARRLWYLAGTDPRECDLPYSGGLCRNLRLFCCTLDSFGCEHTCRCCCSSSKGRGSCGSKQSEAAWQPEQWAYPGSIMRDSTNWRENLWENSYWSMC